MKGYYSFPLQKKTILAVKSRKKSLNQRFALKIYKLIKPRYMTKKI